MSANIFCFSSDIPAPSRDNRSNAHNRLELVRWAFHYFVCRLTYTRSQAVARIADRTASQQTPVHRCSLNFLIRCTNLWWTDNLCTLCLTAVTIRLPPRQRYRHLLVISLTRTSQVLLTIILVPSICHNNIEKYVFITFNVNNSINFLSDGQLACWGLQMNPLHPLWLRLCSSN